jgi:hypothetical protein
MRDDLYGPAPLWRKLEREREEFAFGHAAMMSGLRALGGILRAFGDAQSPKRLMRNMRDPESHRYWEETKRIAAKVAT